MHLNQSDSAMYHLQRDRHKTTVTYTIHMHEGHGHIGFGVGISGSTVNETYRQTGGQALKPDLVA